MQAWPILLTEYANFFQHATIRNYRIVHPTSFFSLPLIFSIDMNMFLSYIKDMKSKYEIAAAIALEGKDNYTGVMPAAEQRAIFGRAIFGRKSIKIDNRNQGTVKVRQSVAFGHDCNVVEFSFEQIAELANNQDQKVRW